MENFHYTGKILNILPNLIILNCLTLAMSSPFPACEGKQSDSPNCADPGLVNFLFVTEAIFLGLFTVECFIRKEPVCLR